MALYIYGSRERNGWKRGEEPCTADSWVGRLCNSPWSAGTAVCCVECIGGGKQALVDAPVLVYYITVNIRWLFIDNALTAPHRGKDLSSPSPIVGWDFLMKLSATSFPYNNRIKDWGML